MNGGMTECGRCDCDPCRCEAIAERKRLQKVSEGQVVIESLWRTMVFLPNWKKKIIKWLWPDIIDVAEDLKEYYWSK